jgi:D-amino peptidase
MKTALLALVAAISVFAQPKTIFMITDAEGVAGICRQAQTDPKDSEMRQLFTGEINSANPGFVDGGATDVFVWDGHGGSETLSV